MKDHIFRDAESSFLFTFVIAKMLLQVRNPVVVFCFWVFCTLYESHSHEIYVNKKAPPKTTESLENRLTMLSFASSDLAAAIALLCSAIPWVNFFMVALVNSSTLLNLQIILKLSSIYMVRRKGCYCVKVITKIHFTLPKYRK